MVQNKWRAEVHRGNRCVASDVIWQEDEEEACYQAVMEMDGKPGDELCLWSDDAGCAFYWEMTEEGWR